MRSFILKLQGTGTYAAPETKTFAAGGRHSWVTDIFESSRFDIQGFKNIDLYGIKMVGNVKCQKNAVIGQVNVSDFSMDIIVDGQLPLISGQVTPPPIPNYWDIYVNNVGARTFTLAKFSNEIQFANPIKSATNFQFTLLRASGTDWETVDTSSLEWDLTFVFFYKYEGE